MLKDKNMLIGCCSDKSIKTHYSLNKKSSRNVYKIEKLCKRIQKLSRKDEFINTEVGISIMMNIGNKCITSLLSGNTDSVYKSLELIKRDLSHYEELEEVRKELNKEVQK
jgi:hypothetical protein